MNKLTKIGVSALCGSLASVAAAHAGALSVTGGATATYVSNENSVTGNPIGLSSGILFTGTGELDNGTTFTLTLSNTDQSAYSSGSIALATPGMGTFTIDQGAGGVGIDRYDDMMPTAWEETNGTGLGTGLQTIPGVSGQASIDWKMSADMLPDGLGVAIAYTPRATGANGANDKASSGTASEGTGAGWDIAVEHSALADGFKLFAGYSLIDQEKTSASAVSGIGTMDDRQQVVLGATYAVGGLTLGYQQSRDSRGDRASSYYDNTAYGVSFAINDDLTLSYGNHQSERGLSDGSNPIELQGESLQLSYTMGGASIKFAETSVDNASYQSTTTFDKDGTTIALTLAF